MRASTGPTARADGAGYRRLLGTHVQDGAEDHVAGGDSLGGGNVDRLGDPEVRDEGAARVEENVVRLDVAVHDTAGVCVL